MLEYYKQQFLHRISDADYFYYLPKQEVWHSYYYLDGIPFLFDEETNEISLIEEEKKK